jgi:hypothetical protein
VLTSLYLQGFTHILLNAIPKPDPRYGNENARKKLVKNYRRLGFRLMDASSGAMKAKIETSMKKCKGLTEKSFDEVLGLREIKTIVW